MFRKLIRTIPAFVLIVVSTAPPSAAMAQERARHPRLHAALAELREARREVSESRFNWPPGHKKRALAAMDDAMQSLKAILAVKGDDFRGLDRGPDFYKRFGGPHPRLRAAMQDLREGREELQNARAEFGNRRERALQDIDVAIEQIGILLHK